MIIRTATRGNLELRTGPSEFGNTDPLRMRLANQYATSGVPVTNERVWGLPTLVQALRIVAQNLAQIPATVYDERPGPLSRVEAVGCWQHDLIRKPSLDSTWFQLMSDVSCQIDGYGNAFVQKIKFRKKVLELRPIDPNRVRVYADANTGEKLFDVTTGGGGRPVTYTTGDILHFRGFSMDSKLSGLSLVQQYRQALGNILAIGEFAGRYWAQAASPSGYISIPDADLDPNELDQILEKWEERHGGLANVGRPAILSAGAKFEVLPLSMADAQYVSTNQWNVDELARMADVPVELLSRSNAETAKTEEVMNLFLTLHARPRLERIKGVFNEDPDLFYGSPYSIDFNWQAIQVADLAAHALWERVMRQAGIMTANELRQARGLPPHPDGDVLQVTPVGGGQNLLASTGTQAPDPAGTEVDLAN